ncbi:MAG: hypothetical protein ACREQR_04325 [Candidatus Binataceae bacterium]
MGAAALQRASARALPPMVHPLVQKAALATRLDIVFEHSLDIFEWLMALAVIAAA